MTKTLVLFGLGVALLVAFVVASFEMKTRTSGFSIQAMEPVEAPLAAKAEDGCWFKVSNKSSRADEVKRWDAVSSVGARTERLGELLIVTGAMQPAVRDDHFYGCALFQYSEGSPVVMRATTSPAPVRADNVIPFGFSEAGKKLQQ